jgi:hypothetical protein
MIINTELLIEYLAKWISDYTKSAERNVLVVGFNGTRSDALLLHICSKATEKYGGLLTHALNFPTSSMDIKTIFNGKVTYAMGDYTNLGYYYLQCSEIANNNGIVIGPIDRTFGLYYRSYGKLVEANADIFPLFDLDYSDIIDMTNSLWPEKQWPQPPDNVSDIEFCNEAESLYGIITGEDSPNRHYRWPYFIHSQKAIIAKVHQREKLTRHKALTRPYPVLSDKPQLCKRIA